jgi:membrane protein implicated in regulation of membrane protease activity
MVWWLWALLGIVLLVVEVVTPGGFFAIFFAMGALLVSAMVGLNLGGPNWLQWLLFSILSIVSLLVFRGRLLTLFQPAKRHSSHIDTLVGEVATLLGDLPPGGVGKAELRGSVWNVQNTDEQPLHKGQRCRVQRVEGLALWVRAL